MKSREGELVSKISRLPPYSAFRSQSGSAAETFFEASRAIARDSGTSASTYSVGRPMFLWENFLLAETITAVLASKVPTASACSRPRLFLVSTGVIGARLPGKPR
jgi:hypothetical protein